VLRRLTITSFALVDHVELEFGKGLTVLLGETGAGKSIIIDALSVALGERASSDVVRNGRKKAVIEAMFTDASQQLQEFLAARDLLWENPEVVIRREISSSGTSRVFVNDTPTQLPVVREIASYLIDFHGQHDTHGLLAAASHREMLDRYAGALPELRPRMKQAWDNVTTAASKLDAIKRRANDADADRARLCFLRDEIAAIHPVPGEDAQVEEELRRAESQEHVVAAAMRVRDALYAAENSAYDQLRASKDLLQQLLKFDSTLLTTVSDIESALIVCKEVAGIVAPLADPEAASPERIEELRQRFVLLQRLTRKYGSLDNALEQLNAVTSELELLENLDESIMLADNEVAHTRSVAGKLSKELHDLRSTHARKLAGSVESSLQEMGMQATNFEISIETCQLGPAGSDSIEFLFSSNPGEPPRQLSKVASGGELSRLMLSLKRALSTSASYGTMVFDEIDTGISGRIARIVGDIMKTISGSQQIICITHLPQIASLADQFIRVTKTADATSTVVAAQAISGDEALVEVAKLLSGDDVSDVSLSGARELMTPKKRTASK
jgi:DNA repair protein RecN (Recombination protein N)